MNASGGSSGFTPLRRRGKPAATPSPRKHFGVRMALFALDCYKAYFSVLFAGSCRFEPTCSRYTYEAITRFGVARGVWLGLKRLARCHPLSGRFGYDPAPENFQLIGSREEMEEKNSGRSEDRPLHGHGVCL